MRRSDSRGQNVRRAHLRPRNIPTAACCAPVSRRPAPLERNPHAASERRPERGAGLDDGAAPLPLHEVRLANARGAQGLLIHLREELRQGRPEVALQAFLGK